MQPYQVRAKTACEAVGLDRDRFNEDVAAGIYKCAPQTDAGRVRIFREADLVALYVYAHLRRHGTAAEQAADIACAVCERAQQLVDSGKKIAGDVAIGFDADGGSYCAFGNEVAGKVDGTANLFGSRDFSATEFSPMVRVERFPLGNILSIVKRRVAEVTAALGED
ncbi:MAG: hypothetical protein WAM17_09830 [Rhodoplanes sp.]